MQNVLVTGGAGFIGSNFVRYLLNTEPDVRVINLDLLTYAGSLENLKDLPDPNRHIFVKGDICDQILLEDLLREHQIDTIVHFAAETHVDRSILGPGQFIQTNVVGTFKLLEAARKIWLEKSVQELQQYKVCVFTTSQQMRFMALLSLTINHSQKPRTTRRIRHMRLQKQPAITSCVLMDKPMGCHTQSQTAQTIMDRTSSLRN